MRLFFVPAAWGLLLASACQPDHAPATAAAPAPVVPAPRPDSAARSLSPALHQQIRRYVAQVNARPNWSAVDTLGLDEPGEGGEAIFYTWHGQLGKLSVRHYGEMGQVRTAYYLLRGRPSFVQETKYRYNRPIYYTAQVMRENHDTEAFDFNKSDSTLTRSYFDATGQLVAQTGPVARDSLAVPGHLAHEQARLRSELATLRHLAGQPRP